MSPAFEFSALLLSSLSRTAYPFFLTPYSLLLTPYFLILIPYRMALSQNSRALFSLAHISHQRTLFHGTRKGFTAKRAKSKPRTWRSWASWPRRAGRRAHR